MRKQLSRALIQPVILAGGMGTRLAPISTPERPKPFVPLADGSSLYTRTLQRVDDPKRFSKPLVIGRHDDRFALLNHARAAQIRPSAILLEPEPRNTAMAIAVATAFYLHSQPEAVLAILPADHWIERRQAWMNSLQKAATASVTNKCICLLTVRPDSPDSAYGYIELGAQQQGQFWQKVEAFIEKPDYAAELIASGAQWNSGQLVAKVRVLAQLFSEHAPDIWHTAQQGMFQAKEEWEFTLLPPEPYLHTRSIAFDRAVLEQCSSIAVPIGSDWQDLGIITTWERITGLTISHYKSLPLRCDRPWGYYESIVDLPERVEKILMIYPGCRLSKQRHFQRDEVWKILEGIATIEKNDQLIQLSAGDIISIPAGCWHRVANENNKSLIIHESQTGAPSESDIERIADDYGRI